MKRITIFILLIAVVLTIASCQPTPAEPVVVSKNDGRLQDAIYGEPAEPRRYEAEEKWAETLESSDGRLTVRIDAGLSVPCADTYPVYRVSAADLTETDVESVYRCFGGGSQLYRINNPTVKIKSYYDEPIKYNKRLIEAMRNKDDPEHKKYLSGFGSEAELALAIPEIEDNLERLMREQAKAPDDYDKTPVDIRLEKSTDDNFPRMMFEGVTEDNGMTISAYVSISPARTMQGINVNYVRRGAGIVPDAEHADGTGEDIPGAVCSYSEALSRAEQILNDLGKFYYLNDSYTSHADDRYFYTFRFVPIMPNGEAMSFYADMSDTRTAVSIPWQSAYINIIIDANGEVVSYNQFSSIEFGKVLNENVRLLPYAQIQETARKYLLLSPNYVWSVYEAGQEAVHTYLDVTDIRLGYIKISEKNNVSSGLCLPVWMFYGSQTDEYIDQNHSGWILDENNQFTYEHDPCHAILCINAVDGSIIDLTQGY